MKKIFFIAALIAANTLVSCTADEDTTTSPAATSTEYATGGEGATIPLPPSPIKP